MNLGNPMLDASDFSRSMSRIGALVDSDHEPGAADRRHDPGLNSGAINTRLRPAAINARH